MALEPAGISLQAENFNKYIKQLGKINRAQDAIFDVDSSKLDRAFTKAEKSSKGFGSSLQSGIDKGVKGFGSLGAAAATGFGAVAIAAAGAATAIGAVGVAVFNVAQDTDQATRQIAAGLGISAAEAANKYNDAVQQIFIDNPQAQFAEIAEAITLTQRALDGLSPDAVEDISGQAIKISQQFNQDLPKVVGAFEQSIEQLGLTGDQAADFITASLQRLPVDDAIDSINEYSGALSDMGFSGDEAFSLLLGGAQGSILGTDRAIDAINEFNVRFIEGGDEIEKSFATLGLNFNQFRQAAEQGTGTASDAFKAFINRAQEVDLSIASNRAAVNALGSQFEGLSAETIKALDPDAIGFEDVAGAANSLDERFNTLGAAFTSVKRGALVALAPIGQTVLELANSIVPKIKAAFEAVRPAIEAFAARIVPAFQFGAEALGRLTKTLGGASSGASTFESILNGLAFVIEGVAGGIEILARVAETFRQTLAFARAGIAAFGSIVDDIFSALLDSFGLVGSAFKKFVSGDFGGAIEDLSTEVLNFDKVMANAGMAAVDAFKDSVFREAETTEVAEVPVEIVPTAPTEPDMPIVPDAPLKPAIQNLEDYQSALQQAENLQRSFAQEAEDSALKVARANEDVARKQAQSVAKLQEKQAKDRDKLLKDQAKKLDKFEADRRKQIAKAESDVQKARKEAADQRKRDQQKLQRELTQAREKFNLSQLQSERRFSLSERRLIAEGDILAIQQLREDRELERQEEKENFNQGQKERVQSAEEQQREQAKDLESRVNELKSNLEDQRAELLQSFDEQLAAQVQAQAQAKAEQQKGFQEQAAERQIQLAREEEDRRISQQRQLEDLGRSLSEQKNVTEEGTQLVADEIEKVFGTEGVADNIFTGFKERTESDFRDLFKNIQEAAKEIDIEPEPVGVPSAGSGFGGRIGGIPEFQEGGIVPGPVGSPQIVQAHAGETILPTHQRSFTMAAPVVPSQNLEVNMSGGFNITGDGQANEQILQQATREMTENFRIAVRRLARRN